MLEALCSHGGGVSGGSYLASKVGTTTLGHLQDDRGLSITGGLERRNDGGGRGDVLVTLSVASHIAFV